MWTVFGFFFFQAEDGIRDKLVTGVQTCALPICAGSALLDAGVEPAPRVPGRRMVPRVPQNPLARRPQTVAGHGTQRRSPGEAGGRADRPTPPGRGACAPPPAAARRPRPGATHPGRPGAGRYGGVRAL